MAKSFYAIPAGFESEEEEIEHMLAELKIKRLEDITKNAGLNGRHFDAELDAATLQRFTAFRTIWQNSKSKPPHIHQNLRHILLSHPQQSPLVLALQLFANCPDSSNLKSKSLSHFVLETVCKMQLEMPHLSDNCDDHTRMTAFNFVKTAGMLSLAVAMIETYRLRQIRDMILPKLRELLDQGYYKETAQWAIHLQLTHEFEMLELAFPLVAQEKTPLAEEYLDKATHQRLPFVKFLDSLLHKDKSVIEMCEPILDRYKNLKVSHQVLSYRPISKIVSRLARKYNFDDSITPNFKFTKTCSYLHHLFREYEKSRIGLEAYRELVSDQAYNQAIQIDFVHYVAAAQALNEALYWYRVFQLKPAECPREIKSLISSKKIDEYSADGRDCEGAVAVDADNVYLSLDLPDECLVIVDTPEKFEAMLNHLKRENIIFIDSEWKQNVCVDSQLCLLQIATPHSVVYLIDCLAGQAEPFWRALGSLVFNNENILKVGFSLLNDLAVLQRSLPLQLRLQTPNHYLDLRNLWQALKKPRQGVELPYGNIMRSGDALTDLTSLCLGKKLNKANQCSNWANRPLRRDQIVYAAMDARCLFLIYNTLVSCVPQINVAIEKSLASNNFFRRGNANK